MLKRTVKWSLRATLLLTVVLALAGCGGDSPSPATPALISAEQRGEYDVATLRTALLNAEPSQQLSAALGVSAGGVNATEVRNYVLQYIDVPEVKARISATQVGNVLRDVWLLIYNNIYPILSYNVKAYRITYKGAGYENLTGLLVVPSDPANPDRTFPMLAYQHPTQVLRSQSPGNYDEKGFDFDDQLSIPWALSMGSAGYITVVADYPGLGGNKDVHPYCMKNLGQVVTAMMQATKEHLAKIGRSSAFNKDLYLMGFSEGGYATVVTAQDVQQNHKEYNLKKVAALDGPHSLSDTMRKLMLNADATYSSPYFLPYVIDGYGAAYGSTVSIMKFENAIINPKVIPNAGLPAPEDFNPNLRAKLNGEYGGNAISGYMRLVTPYEGPRSILVKGFTDALNDTKSAVNAKLRENDAVNGWTPSAATEFHFYHNWFDDLVPYDNSDVATKEWSKYDNVKLVTFYLYVPGLGSTHAGSLPWALIKSLWWIW